MAWYGMIWYSMVWYGMVWYGMVWHGMVWPPDRSDRSRSRSSVTGAHSIINEDQIWCVNIEEHMVFGSTVGSD